MHQERNSRNRHEHIRTFGLRQRNNAKWRCLGKCLSDITLHAKIMKQLLPLSFPTYKAVHVDSRLEYENQNNKATGI